MSRLQPSERVLYAVTCQGRPVSERLAAARACGFTAITLLAGDFVTARAEGLDYHDLRAMIAEAGLRLANIEMIGNWAPGQRADTPLLPRAMAEALLLSTPEKICRAAVALGSPAVTVADLFGLPFDGPIVARHFAHVCEIAADHGLTVTLEFVSTGCVQTVAQAREVLERADCSNAGILIDSFHFFRTGSSFDDLARVPSEMIAAWQMNDAAASPVVGDAFADMMIRTMPGEGEFDLGRLMRSIAATGTKAPGGIEAFSAEIGRLPFVELAQRSAEALDYCLALSAVEG